MYIIHFCVDFFFLLSLQASTIYSFQINVSFLCVCSVYIYARCCAANPFIWAQSTNQLAFWWTLLRHSTHLHMGQLENQSTDAFSFFVFKNILFMDFGMHFMIYIWFTKCCHYIEQPMNNGLFVSLQSAKCRQINQIQFILSKDIFQRFHIFSMRISKVYTMCKYTYIHYCIDTMTNINYNHANSTHEKTS